MPTDRILADLQAQGLLPPAQAAAIAAAERNRPFSLHYELRTLLYLGITLLSGGLGVLIYQNIDHIGHGVVVGGIAALMLTCFFYAARHRQPFTWGQPPRVGFLPDYVLLLGCLLFLTLEGYLQAQYNVFGTRYGLAAFLPAVVFFGLAYLFDHRGVLAMAVTALASWVGVSVAPVSTFTENNFASAQLSGAAITLGVVLLAVGLLSEYENRKRHFAFTYLSLGSNLALIAATAVTFEAFPLPWLPPVVAGLLVLALSALLVWYARRTHSYVFLLLGALYGYIVVSYFFFELVDYASLISSFLILLYFPLTAVSIILLFVNSKKLIGRL